MSAPSVTETTWIRYREAIEMGLTHGALKKLVDSGALSVRRLPKARPRVRRDEVEALVNQSTYARRPPLAARSA
jgi:hypothetical protein